VKSGQPSVICDRGHFVVSSVLVPCNCGGHDRYQCRMRCGSKPCGWSVLVPAISDACGDDED
jgi:hypothetical protein